MRTLVLVEHDHHVMQPSIRYVLAAALQLDSPVTLLVVGENCEAVAEQAAALAGVEAVWVADNPCYAHQFPENVSQLVASVVTPFSAVLAASSTYGKNTMPRIAARLDVAQISDVTRIVTVTPMVVEHPIYAGNAIETVQLHDLIKIMTIRPTAFEPITEIQSPCSIERIDGVFTSEQTTFVSHELSQSSRPELSDAKVIVSGGRGLQSAEQFKLIEVLADVLGAGVGASRAAVDAGFVGNDHQIGQTGKIVAPLLYIAVGISGAVQHVAGMKDSKVIVAINKDPDAPIFKVADYGLVGDLFVVVPQLIEQLNNLRKSS